MPENNPPPGDPPAAGRQSAGLPTTLADYELLRRIGAGAYGDVWLARDAVGKHVAVKVIDLERMALLRQANREERALRLLRTRLPEHPHLIRVHHVGRDAGRLYYVMDLASNLNAPADTPPTAPLDADSYRPKTLADELAGGSALPVGEAVAVVRELLGAVRCLHEHGIVHRDIKPSNIIFVDGAWKLADIGLLAEETTQLTAIGTPDFMPPGGRIDRTADLYALGKVLYCLVTGNPPRAFPQIPRSVRDHQQRGLISEVNDAIARACAPRPEDRFASAEAFDAALRRCRTRIGRAWPRKIRRRVIAAVCLLTVGAIAVWWFLTVTAVDEHVSPQYAWSENIGWMLWQPADGHSPGFSVHDTFLSGFIWAENIGWINTGNGPVGDVHYANLNGEDFGVNVDACGELFGLAWGENVGWISFDTASLGDRRARFDAKTGRFHGYAWSENSGWISLEAAEPAAAEPQGD